MSAYPNQPRSRGGWAEPPPSSGYDPEEFPGPRGNRYGPYRRRRRRWPVVLLVIIVVLGAVFVAADRFARSYAQTAVASKAVAYGFPTKPTVDIKGFPFLTQVAARDVGEVDLGVGSTAFGNLRVASLRAVATDVRLKSAAGGSAMDSYGNATVDTVTGTAVIPFTAFLSAIGAKDGVRLAPDPAAGPQAVKVSAGQLNAEGKISLRGHNQIFLKVENVGGIPLSALGVPSGYTLGMPSLPFGLTLTGVSVTGQGISVQGTAHNVALGQGPAGSG